MDAVLALGQEIGKTWVKKLCLVGELNGKQRTDSQNFKIC